MNDKRLPFTLLPNEWNKVKSKRCPQKCWLAHVNYLKKELNLQDKLSLGNKSNQKSFREKRI